MLLSILSISSILQDDDLHVEKKIDANWFEGYHGDAKGIFPVAYVQITEGIRYKEEE